MLALFATLFSAFACVQRRSVPILMGDGWFYAATCASLLQDGDLDLSNQLKGTPEFFSTHLALGVHGTLYPKHPILLPVLSVPFLSAFGIKGLLYFNLIAASLAMLFLFRLALSQSSTTAALLACLAVAFGTFLPWYLSLYLADIFAAALVIAGLFLLFRERSGGSDGLLLSLALLAKPPNFVFWVVGLAVRAARRKVRPLVLYVLLSLPALGAFLWLNQVMFGSPLTTGYDRILVAEGGRLSTRSTRADWDQPTVKGLKRQLFDRGLGLLPTCPVLLAAVPGLAVLWRKNRAMALSILVSPIGMLVLFSGYRLWDEGPYGHRYMMAPVLLGAVPIAAGIEWLLAPARRQEAASGPLSPGS